MANIQFWINFVTYVAQASTNPSKTCLFYKKCPFILTSISFLNELFFRTSNVNFPVQHEEPFQIQVEYLNG